jgi:hypothetical protein
LDPTLPTGSSVAAYEAPPRLTKTAMVAMTFEYEHPKRLVTDAARYQTAEWRVGQSFI